MRLSKRRLDEAMREWIKIRDAEKALLVLQGYRPCPFCKGSRVAAYGREIEMIGRQYHFKRTCGFCSQTEVPGFFSKTEASDYALDQYAVSRGGLRR